VAVLDVHVDAQHLAQQHLGSLRAEPAASASITKADVEVAVRAEDHGPALVHGRGLRDQAKVAGPHEIEAAGGVEHQRVGGAPVSRDDHIADAEVGVAPLHPVDERSRAVGGERQSEEPLLGLVQHLGGDVEERCGLHHAVHDCAGRPSLFEDDQRSGRQRIGHDGHRPHQALGDELGAKLGARGVGGPQDQGGNEDGKNRERSFHDA
jgi:hypothetical protein